jgi:alpha-tubulin suppressor-like RCC1 family protein
VLQALASDGNVFAWGLNIDGELADGDTTQRTVPQAITRYVLFSFLSHNLGVFLLV